MSERLLTVEDLAVARGGVPLLSGVSLDVAAGEALVLRGPNGVGKTSLLRTLAGLQPAAAGQIEAAAVVYAGHLDGIKATLSVRENLSFWAAMHGVGDVEAALTGFELEDLADRSAGQLSAGQKRRLGLARLLVSGRRLWLMDEPTVSLDREAVVLFAGVVGGHLARGGAAVIATHIDLGIDAQELELGAFRAGHEAQGVFDEAFL